MDLQSGTTDNVSNSSIGEKNRCYYLTKQRRCLIGKEQNWNTSLVKVLVAAIMLTSDIIPTTTALLLHHHQQHHQQHNSYQGALSLSPSRITLPTISSYRNPTMMKTIVHNDVITDSCGGCSSISRRKTVLNSSSRSSFRQRVVTRLRAKMDDNDTTNDDDADNKKASTKNDENIEGNKDATNSDDNSIKQKFDEVVQKVLQTKIPFKTSLTISSVLRSLTTWLLSIRKSLSIGVFSFLAGIILTVSAIFVPVYSSVEKLSEPVTLFETILSDLDQGYVDQVDTNKLFETGVSAMLSSLDPYTEFEGKQEAQALNEGIEGKYGGVGLVITGRTTDSVKGQDKLQKSVDNKNKNAKDGDLRKKDADSYDEFYEDDDFEEEDDELLQFQQKLSAKQKERGINVVTAFEGYAFDYGIRVGDKLVAVDSTAITEETSVEDVRNMLRGVPGTDVTISFEREGIKGVQSITMPRTVVRLRDVKLATLLGNKQQQEAGNTIGYIQLTGFSQNAGAEVRNAILSLQARALDATDGKIPLQGLVLDLRGNPGGLLTSAVDVSSLLVPKNSDIVSAKGRGFPGVMYRSRVDPILDTSTTKLAVLVNGGTASAAEIVSGAVQDLDVGIIVGNDRTFGKGLVQNVESLPFDTALKFTVAKYYTPSGRCIQGINYSEGGGLQAMRSDSGEESGSKSSRYIENKVAEDERSVYFTRNGRIVKDGGGIEADYKVSAPKASALEITLLRSGMFSDYAAQWSRTHELTNNFQVDDATYKDFRNFVFKKQDAGDIKLEALYSRNINDLRKALKQSKYRSSTDELDKLQATVLREIYNDFDKYKTDIQEDLSQNILARYLPESMLLERGVKSDKQVNAAVRLLSNRNKFDKLLAKGSSTGGVSSTNQIATSTTISSNLNEINNNNINNNIADKVKESEGGAMLNLEW